MIVIFTSTFRRERNRAVRCEEELYRLNKTIGFREHRFEASVSQLILIVIETHETGEAETGFSLNSVIFDIKRVVKDEWKQTSIKKF